MADGKRKISQKPESTAAAGGDRLQPDVLVEFSFAQGLLFASVRNIGSGPAIRISVSFDTKIFGLGGTREISSLGLFKNIEFLGPGREIGAFVDTSHSYFRRKQPTRISARVRYQDRAGRQYEVTIKHDLEIYRDLSYVTPNDDSQS